MNFESKVIFFDIDGTMLSTGGAGQRAMELALVEEFQVDFPFDGILTAGRTDCGIADEIFERFRLNDTPAERTRFERSYLDRLSHCLNELPGALLPGVVDLLEQLHDHQGFELSLLTGNYAEGAWIKLRHFGIDHFFSHGGFGDLHARRDDVAGVALQAASAALGRHLNGSESIVLGDTPADIQCARAIKARAIAVATGVYDSSELSRHDPDHLFEDLGDTGRVLDVLLKG